MTSYDKSIDGTLTLVATPIGNLEDITIRALSILRDVDLILCEDTRKTGFLLGKYNIRNTLCSFHEHNEQRRIDDALHLLQGGKNIALVSDAGTPLQSDPGYKLVCAARNNHIPVTAAPGAHAAVTGVILSGLPPYPYLFVGFLPTKKVARRKFLQKIAQSEEHGIRPTLVFYESPKRLQKTLVEMNEIFDPQRLCCIGRELTKKFEENRCAPLHELVHYYDRHTIRGEIVITLAPMQPKGVSLGEIAPMIAQMRHDYALKDVARLLSEKTGISKREIYQYGVQHPPAKSEH